MEVVPGCQAVHYAVAMRKRDLFRVPRKALHGSKGRREADGQGPSPHWLYPLMLVVVPQPSPQSVSKIWTCMIECTVSCLTHGGALSDMVRDRGAGEWPGPHC